MSTSTTTAATSQTTGQDAVAGWVEEHGDYLFRYAMKRTRDEDLAEELVQETFLAAVKSSDSFKGQSAVKTWLVGILKHKLLDHLRKASRDRTISFDLNEKENALESLFDESGHWAAGQEPKPWSANPLAIAEQKDFLKVLDTCLEKLPDRLRDVFSLRELDQTPSAEICEALGISSSNLWVMLHRARQRLRTCIDANWLEGN